jgi:hypothetical protein
MVVFKYVALHFTIRQQVPFRSFEHTKMTTMTSNDETMANDHNDDSFLDQTQADMISMIYQSWQRNMSTGWATLPLKEVPLPDRLTAAYQGNFDIMGWYCERNIFGGTKEAVTLYQSSVPTDQLVATTVPAPVPPAASEAIADKSTMAVSLHGTMDEHNVLAVTTELAQLRHAVRQAQQRRTALQRQYQEQAAAQQLLATAAAAVERPLPGPAATRLAHTATRTVQATNTARLLLQQLPTAGNEMTVVPQAPAPPESLALRLAHEYKMDSGACRTNVPALQRLHAMLTKNKN